MLEQSRNRIRYLEVNARWLRSSSIFSLSGVTRISPAVSCLRRSNGLRKSIMHSSTGVQRSPQDSSGQAPVLDLRLVDTGERRTAAAHFRRGVVACEAVADVVTIILGVLLGYVVYSSFALGKHIHYPTHAVWVWHLRLLFSWS